MSGLSFTGTVWRLGDDIDTDAILPARYLNLTQEDQLGLHFMEDVLPGFAAAITPGDILIAGENFGCGSSREHAPMAIRGRGFSCVVATSFSRLFFRNAINIGLPVLTSQEIGQIAQPGARLTVDCLAGTIQDLSSGKTLAGTPLSPFMQEILVAGGLIAYLERRIAQGD